MLVCFVCTSLRLIFLYKIYCMVKKIKGGEKAFHNSKYDQKKKNKPTALSGGQRKSATICKIERTFVRPQL